MDGVGRMDGPYPPFDSKILEGWMKRRDSPSIPGCQFASAQIERMHERIDGAFKGWVFMLINYPSLIF